MPWRASMRSLLLPNQPATDCPTERRCFEGSQAHGSRSAHLAPVHHVRQRQRTVHALIRPRVGLLGHPQRKTTNFPQRLASRACASAAPLAAHSATPAMNDTEGDEEREKVGSRFHAKSSKRVEMTRCLHCVWIGKPTRHPMALPANRARAHTQHPYVGLREHTTLTGRLRHHQPHVTCACHRRSDCFFCMQLPVVPTRNRAVPGPASKQHIHWVDVSTPTALPCGLSCELGWLRRNDSRQVQP